MCCSMIAALRAVLALRQSRVCRLTNWGAGRKQARLQHEDGTALNADAWLDSAETECALAERPCQREFNGQVVPVRVLALRLPKDAGTASAGASPKDCRSQNASPARTDDQTGWLGYPGEHVASQVFSQ